MKRITYILFSALLVLSSCEKVVDKGEYGNPLLKFYGDAKSDIGYSIAEISDGYIICGKLTVITRDKNDAEATIIVDEDPQLGVIKVNRSGIQQWEYTGGGSEFDEGRKIVVLNDGSFVCLGTTTVESGLGQNKDVFITKISSSGSMIWENSIGGLFDQEGLDIVESSNGFVIAGSTSDYTGGTGNTPGNRDFFVLSVSSLGDSLGSYSYGYAYDDFAERLVALPNDNFLLIGTTDQSSTDTPGQAGSNIMIGTAKVLAGGEIQFNPANTKIYGGADNEEFSDAVSIGSCVALVGTRNFGLDSREGIFKIFDISDPGSLPLSIEFKDFTLERDVVSLNSLTIMPGVGYMASGTTGGTDSSGDMLFMFLDQDGNNSSKLQRYETGGTGLQEAFDAILDSNGKFVAVGANSYENNSLVTLLKFDPWE